MKAVQREFLADLRAAAALARPEAVNAALLGLRRLPEVAGNQPLSDGLIQQLLRPAGELLASPHLPGEYLLTLSRDPMAAVRALAGAAMLHHTLDGETAFAATLQRLAGERREDVRMALAGASAALAQTHPDQLLALASGWLMTAPHPQTPLETRARQQSTALLLLRSLAGRHAPALLEMIQALSADLAPEANAALAELLTALAEAGSANAVLDFLERWAADSPPRGWLISRVLAGGWALGYVERAESILAQLESRTGTTRHITNARRALSRKAED